MNRGWTMRASRFACRLVGAFLLVSLVVLGSATARADPPPPAEGALIYSPYERETIELVLNGLAATQDEAPEGKTIERVDIVPLDVLEPRDPLPGWLERSLNALHATTRPRVVRRELLVREGEPYRQVLVDDTVRNLRRLPQLSLVLAVATRASSPDRVGLVVITKDVWSLRASWNIVGTPGGIEEFELQPKEENFFGTHQTALGEFVYQPSTYTFGLGYSVPRLDGSRLALVTSADVVVNRASGSPEGSLGSLIAGQPLYSGVAEWAWDATVDWDDRIHRRYVNAQPGTFTDPSVAAGNGCLLPYCIPFQYRTREFQADYEVTRSFGWDIKHDFTVGAGVTHTVNRAEFPGAAPRTVAAFVARYVPVSDTSVGPWFEYHTYSKRYLRVIDFETLALQEDYHLGPELLLGIEPNFSALGATRDSVNLVGSLQYTAAVRDGFFRALAESTTQPELDGNPRTGAIANATLGARAHLVSPSLGPLGRLVADGSILYRWRNYLNDKSFISSTGAFLGGNNRLRGYPTNFFIAQDYVTYNFEFRSRPVEILSCQLGGVLFYDAGGAAEDLAQLETFQSVGFGLRALFPQLDRIVFRADLGFPIERPVDTTGVRIAPLAFLLTFGQAFGVPTITPTPVLPTGESELVNE